MCIFVQKKIVKEKIDIHSYLSIQNSTKEKRKFNSLELVKDEMCIFVNNYLLLAFRAPWVCCWTFHFKSRPQFPVVSSVTSCDILHKTYDKLSTMKKRERKLKMKFENLSLCKSFSVGGRDTLCWYFMYQVSKRKSFSKIIKYFRRGRIKNRACSVLNRMKNEIIRR